MSLTRTMAALLFATLATALLSDPGDARERSQSPASRIRIEYVAPANPEHRLLYEKLKQRRVLEELRNVLSPLRLPKTLTLKLDGCNGVANAWYEDRAVKVCYEYIEEVIRNAPREKTPQGILPEDAIVGPVVEVFLHEVGHAVFDMLEIPILGREEDAADQFAAYMLLQLGAEDVRRVIGGIAYMYAQEALKSNLKLKDFSDEHGLPAQRFYNLLCMAYGAYPTLFADVVEKDHLPKARAEGCEDEYRQVSYAIERLIVPHLDSKQRARVRAQAQSRQLFRANPSVGTPP